jgi:hypothetical protein
MTTEVLIVAGTAALATVLYYCLGLVVLRSIFTRRELPRSPVGRLVAFLATRLIILPVLEIVDWLASVGDRDVASRLLPEGLEPIRRKPR